MTINLSSSDTTAGTLSTPSSLTFTPDDWDQAQTATLTGVNDTIVGNVNYNLVIDPAVSTDPNYSGITTPNTPVTNLDNDTYNIITVDTTSDVCDGDTSSIMALVHNMGTDGKISLREAILAANNTANGSGGPDQICFNLDGTGTQTIVLASALPAINDSVIIDGTTDSQFHGTPVIELDGENVTNNSGLVLSTGSDGSTIRGLVVNRFGYEAFMVNSNNNTIAGCYVGTDSAGTSALANAWNGGPNAILVGGSNNTIGGVTAADRNVISGNSADGILVSGNTNVVEGNYIGVDATGNAQLANAGNGVTIGVTATGNTIGGTTSGARNVISGNGLSNIMLNGNSNIIEGNYLGPNAACTATFTNAWEGITIWGQYNLIGGTTAGAANVICGNAHAGVWLFAGNNTVQGNYIGTDPTGTLHLGNSWPGICVMSSNNLIGGTDPGDGNLIAYNGLSGVEISNDWDIGNQVLGNSIYGNNGLGIDFDNNGVSYNGVSYDGNGNVIPGPNDWQNFPVLDTANTNGTQVRVTGSLTSNPNYVSTSANTTFRIEFFANTSPDPSSHGEGQRYLGYANVTTDGTGNASFTAVVDAAVAEGEYISATATNLSTHETSEFSQVVVAHTPRIIVTPTSGLVTTEFGSTAQFTVVLNMAPTSDVTIGISSDNTNEGTVSTSVLTFTSSNWNVAQTVTVTGVDDLLPDGNIAYKILTTPAGSMDPNFNGINPSDVSVTNLDNDSYGIAVIPVGNSTTTEDGGQASFYVLLNKAPTSDVTINLSSSDTTAGTLSTPSSLTFTPDDWGQAQTVILTGVNDTIVGNVNYNLVIDPAVSADPNYSGITTLNTPVTNLDNDVYNTIYVNTTSDVCDGDTSSIMALVHNMGTDGKISLREAILAANNTANGSGGPDRIYFDIDGSGVQTIVLNSALPTISDPVIIDGTTDSQFHGTPVIELDGENVAMDRGLVLTVGSSGSTIRGLVVNRFGWEGIYVSSNDNTIAGCYVGTDPTGTTALPNGWNAWDTGICLAGNNNTIGGIVAADRNVISGNAHSGIWLIGNDNVIIGNYIGVDATGNVSLANGNTGIDSSSSPNGTIIGGTVEGAQRHLGQRECRNCHEWELRRYRRQLPWAQCGRHRCH